VARSSLSAETQQAAISEDEAFLIRLMWGELNGATGSHDEIANKSPAYLVVDAKALYDACLNSETSALGLREKRTGIELLGLRENLERNGTKLRWVNSGAMLADAMTKGRMRHLMENFLRNPKWKLVEDPEFESFKKRVNKGNDAFDKKDDEATAAPD
jgi:hypothetical protein